ncbi:MAG: pitrilysin family protein [Chloroflexi bacterium]|nr:pitrilysin family protein [Chloroflexota bacterium]
MPKSSAKSVIRRRLKNGLTVVLKEMHAAPVISFCVWYRVGSRDEHLGITGASHWVEHMMFKGTKRFNETELDRLVSREGGARNAFTWIDFTAYYETMPADRIELAIDLEADRMVNSRFDMREVNSERTVILNEREMYENSPGFRLNEEMQAAAFRVHPYGHEVIGHVTDLRSMTRDDLYAHYQRHYAPGNAVITVAGDFTARDMLAMIEKYFSKIKPNVATPKKRAAVRPRIVEPAQRGERRIIVRGEGETNYLQMAFHAPAADDVDYMALVALDSVLCGASGLSFFGGGTSNRSSRLSKALVDGGYAADIGGGVLPTVDPFLYTISGTVMPGKSIEEMETAIWAEIERIRTQPVENAELEKALKQTRAQVAFSTETVTNQAFWLGFAEIIDDHTWFDTFLERLAHVTREDVQRVAQRYLTRDNVTVGAYLGSGPATGDASSDEDADE